MWVSRWLRQYLRPKPKPPVEAAASPDVTLPKWNDPGYENRGFEPAWCVAANVVLERDFGPDGAEKRHGTKHFAPGAKVYVYDFYWGMGGENVTVMGHHRKSRRYIQLTMAAKHLANWRTELVYSPAVAKVIRENAEFGNLDAGSEHARRRAEEIVAIYIAGGGQSQPFVTRPPADE